MSEFIQFTGQVNKDQTLAWVRQMTIAADGTLTVTTPSSVDFEVEEDGSGKTEIEWNDLVIFAENPAVLLTIIQTSSGNGSRSTATVKSLSTSQATVQIVKSGGDNANRAFSFAIAGST